MLSRLKLSLASRHLFNKSSSGANYSSADFESADEGER